MLYRIEIPVGANFSMTEAMATTLEEAAKIISKMETAPAFRIASREIVGYKELYIMTLNEHFAREINHFFVNSRIRTSA